MKIRTERLPCRVGIVGSRDYPSRSDIFSFVSKIPRDIEIISGGARGVDTWAVEAAEKYGLLTCVFAPDTRLPSPQRYFARNQQIVDRAWAVVAFSVDGGGGKPSRGTADTLRKAETAGIPTIVIVRTGKTYTVTPNIVALEFGLVA